MVSCGEQLEKERVQLRHQLSESRQRHQACKEQLETLRTSLEHEEQLGELLRARAWTLEEDNTALLRRCAEGRCAEALRTESERGRRTEEVARFRAELADAQREHGDLRTELRACRRECFEAERNVAEADAKREKAFATLEEESGRWAQSREAMREEFASEAGLCGEMVAQLRSKLAEVQAEQETLCRTPPRRPTAPSPFASPTSTGPSKPGTPRLRELDAYAELVERLRAEVLREREEKEASARSLTSLRASYRLLLQRVGDSTSGTGGRAPAARGLPAGNGGVGVGSPPAALKSSAATGTATAAPREGLAHSLAR